MPLNGIPTDIIHNETDEFIKSITADVDNSTVDYQHIPINVETEGDRGFVVNEDQIEITTDQSPIDQYNTENLFALSFPCLFPYYEGDITSGSRDRLVKLDEEIEHYKKLGRVMNGELIFPFAKHPSFMFIALDLIERRRLNSQAKVFFQKNEDIRNLSISEVLALLSNRDTRRDLIGRISAYAGNVRVGALIGIL